MIVEKDSNQIKPSDGLGEKTRKYLSEAMNRKSGKHRLLGRDWIFSKGEKR